MFLACPAAALTPVSPAGTEWELEAEITVEDRPLLNKRDEVTVSAVIINPAGTPYNLSLIRYDGADPVLVQAIGAVPPNSRTTVTLRIAVSYPEKSRRLTKYAIIAEQDGVFKMKDFVVDEDWTPYENSIKTSLAQTNIFLVPLISLVLIGVLFFISWIAHRTPPGFFGGEFTTKTFFFPQIRGMPWGERIANVFINPFFWVAEVLCVLWLVSVVYSGSVANLGTDMGTTVFVISGVGALVLPLIYLAVVWYVKRKPARFSGALFICGMFAAFLSFLFSSTYETSAGKALAVAIGLPATIASTVFISPVVEEIAKCLGILVLSWHRWFNNTVTGLLFGFMVGVGFSFIENWFYFASKTSPFELGFLPWVALILYRSSFNSIAHGCFGGACGAIIGYVKSHAGRFPSLGFIPGIFIAVSLHIIFNSSALLDGFMVAEYKFPFFIFNPALVILLLALFILTFLIASKKEAQKEKGEVMFFPG